MRERGSAQQRVPEHKRTRFIDVRSHNAGEVIAHIS